MSLLIKSSLRRVEISLQLCFSDTVAHTASVLVVQMGFEFTPLQQSLDSSSPTVRIKTTRVSKLCALQPKQKVMMERKRKQCILVCV